MTQQPKTIPIHLKAVLVCPLLIHPLIFLAFVSSTSIVMAQSAGTFTATGNMTTLRQWHTATLLPNGKVLIVGGNYCYNYPICYLASAELYDPSTGSFTATGDMTTPRAQHTATLLPNGKVLIVGGETCNSSGCRPSASAELYDPSTGSFHRDRQHDHRAVGMHSDPA